MKNFLARAISISRPHYLLFIRLRARSLAGRQSVYVRSLETRPSPSSTRACSISYNYAWEYFRRQKAWYILSRDACRDCHTASQVGLRTSCDVYTRTRIGPSERCLSQSGEFGAALLLQHTHVVRVCTCCDVCGMCRLAFGAKFKAFDPRYVVLQTTLPFDMRVCRRPRDRNRRRKMRGC